MYTIVTEPENVARHAREYQVLLAWFTRRQHELGLDQMNGGDPMDPSHINIRHCVKQSCMASERNYWPSPGNARLLSNGGSYSTGSPTA